MTDSFQWVLVVLPIYCFPFHTKCSHYYYYTFFLNRNTTKRLGTKPPSISIFMDPNEQKRGLLCLFLYMPPSRPALTCRLELIKQTLGKDWKATISKRLESKNKIAVLDCERLFKIERFGKLQLPCYV